MCPSCIWQPLSGESPRPPRPTGVVPLFIACLSCSSLSPHVDVLPGQELRREPLLYSCYESLSPPVGAAPGQERRRSLSCQAALTPGGIPVDSSSLSSSLGWPMSKEASVTPHPTAALPTSPATASSHTWMSPQVRHEGRCLRCQAALTPAAPREGDPFGCSTLSFPNPRGPQLSHVMCWAV